MVTHVTAHDVSVTRRRNCKIMWHLGYKSSSFAKTSIPIHSEASASGLKEVTVHYHFPGIHLMYYDISSRSHENVM